MTGGTSGTLGAGVGDIAITVFADQAGGPAGGLEPGTHSVTITI